MYVYILQGDESTITTISSGSPSSRLLDRLDHTHHGWSEGRASMLADSYFLYVVRYKYNTICTVEMVYQCGTVAVEPTHKNNKNDMFLAPTQKR